MAVELKVPEVGESVTEVEIGRWLKQEGEAAAKDEPIVEIETDKITVELPAPAEGTVTQMVKKQGDAAQVGDVIGYMEEGAAASGSSAAAASPAPQREHRAEQQAHAAAESARDAGRQQPEARPQDHGRPPSTVPQGDSEQIAPPAETASAEAAPMRGGSRQGGAARPGTAEGGAGGHRSIMPAAQRLLDEHGLAPDDVQASGPGGRLLKEDVQRHLQAQPNGEKDQPAPSASAGVEGPSAPASTEAAPTVGPVEPAPEPEFAPTARGDEETVPMSPMRRKIAARLVQAQQNAALLTTFNEVDMTPVMELRSRYKQSFQETHGVKLGFMSFFVKAAIEALKAYPAVNAEVRGNNIIYRNYYDIGIAVGSGRGLVVPVLRRAERLSFAGIEKAIGDFVQRIQNNKIKLEELQGGTFTITNGGVFGSMLSTPIINPPQSGVLGMHAITPRPMAVEGEIKIRSMMYLALTYDHRIVDGREAVSFLKKIKDTIEDPPRLLLEM